MRKHLVALTCAALLALFAMGSARKAAADLQQFTGTLTLRFETLPSVGVPGSGNVTLGITGANHLASLVMPASAFGPASASIPVTASATINSVRFSEIRNATGSFMAVSMPAPGGNVMGLSGMAKFCLVFDTSCEVVSIPIPLAATGGGAGFGIGGTAIGNLVTQPFITLQHAPWTLGQPSLTIHRPYTTITTPALPGGFAHGPASATSSTAAPGAVLQMVTATKVFTNFPPFSPETPLVGILRIELLRDVCDDNVDNDGDGLTDFPDDPGCDDAGDGSEQSASIACDNGIDDDGDGLVDHQDPGCADPSDLSEQSNLLACDDGADNDGDELVDRADPGCSDPSDPAETDPGLTCDDGLDNDSDGLVDLEDAGCDDLLDPFEQNCGHLIRFTDNTTEDTAPDVSQSQIVWQQWDGGDFEVHRWDGSSSAPLTSNSVLDLAPSIEGATVAWQEWGGGDSRIMVWQGTTAVARTGAGVSGWDPDVDDSGVVWSQGPSLFLPAEAVYYWNGSSTTAVFGSAGGEAPALEDGTIVWETAAGIHMWTGSTTVIIPGSAGGHAPAVWGSRVVWHASDGNDDEIFLWNNSTTQQLTDNTTDDRNADLWGARVVWESGHGIQFWNNGTTALIAGSLGGQFPKIDGLDVVWQAADGSDNEIYLVTLCAACNDGIDNEGDGKIDYDGGLSALGYIAADPDPQCGGSAWRDKETSGPCGLGFELALILPGLMWLHRRRRQLH